MGVAAGGATLEIQLVADVARLKRDMADMQSAVKRATGGVEQDFAAAGRASAQSAAQMAAAAQAAARSAMGMASGVGAAGQASRLSSSHMTNLAFQVQDLSMQMAMAAQSSRPLSMGLMALFQQGTQIQGIGMQAGLSMRQMGVEMLKMVGILKVTTDAEAAMAATMAKSKVEALEAVAARSSSAIAARQTQIALIQAEIAGATSADAQAAAEARLVKVLRQLEAESAKAAVANQALAAAQAESAAASQAASARTVTSLGRVGAALGAAAIAVGLLTAAFSSMKSNALSDAELKKYAEGLGLTKKEMEKLKDVTVTWGDVGKATMQVLAEAAGIDASRLKDAWSKAWKTIGEFAKFSIQIIIASIAALVELGISSVTNLGKVIVAVFVGAANLAIAAIEGLINKVIFSVNALATGANSIINMLPANLRESLGVKNFGMLDPVNLGRVKAELDFSNPLNDMSKRFKTTFNSAGDGLSRISKLSGQFAKDRIAAQAAEIIGDRNATKASKDRGSATESEIAKIERQIDALWRLSDAYQDSDAAALRAEARAKAEEKAIKDKGAVELYYAQELELAIAQRSVDNAKAIADLRAERDARAVVNDQVLQGTIRVTEMGQQMQFLTKRRQMMAAAAVAEENGWLDMAQRIRREIGDLNTAQKNLNEELAREAAIKEMAKKDGEIEKLRLEAQLIGASNRERAVRLAQLEAEQFLKGANIDPASEEGIGVAQRYIDAAIAQDQLRAGQAAYNIELTATADMLALISEHSQELGNLLGSAFGAFGSAIGDVINQLTAYQAKEQEIHDWKMNALKDVAAGSQAAAAIEAQAQQKSSTAQMKAMSGALAAAKSMFKEKSAGYKIITAMEKALAVMQLVNSVKAIAMDATQTASSVANSTARATADTAAGGAKIFSQLGVWAFPVVAAMVAVMASLMGGGGSAGSVSIPAGMSAEDVQAAQGAGTILGDRGAKSQSIENSLELMSKNSTRALDYSSEMVGALRSIRDNIGVLAAAVARDLTLSGGFFDQSQMGLGTTAKKGFLGLIGGSSTTKTLIDQGFNINDAILADILAGGGISGYSYNVIQKVKTKSGFLGIGGGTKTSYKTEKGALPDGLDQLFTDVISSLYDTVVASAKVLGLDVADVLKTFEVEIGKISLQGLKGDEITQVLESIFSKLGDQMAGFAVEGLEDFQKVGEGLFETLNRLAMDYMTIDAALRSIGTTFGAVGASSIAAREELLELSGGLEEFVNQVNYFYDHYLSDEDKQGFMRNEIAAAFQKMNTAVPTSIEAFKDMVLAQDLTTEAGRELYAAMMSVAPAFYELLTAEQKLADAAAKAAEQLERQRLQLQIQLLEAQGRSVEALALKRQMELAALDESLRSLQEEVWLAQDVAAAKKDLLDAYKRESNVLEQTAAKFRRFGQDLRSFRDSLFEVGASNNYNQALAKLMAQGGLAAAGDEAALSGGLREAATNFMEIASANASSALDLARARALVASYVDQGIAGADGQASIAEMQLDQLKAQVGALVSIDENVMTVAEALDRLNSLLAVQIVTPQSSLAPQQEAASNKALEEKLDLLLTATETGTVAMNKVAKVIGNADRGGALAVYTDPDTPINVVNS